MIRPVLPIADVEHFSSQAEQLEAAGELTRRTKSRTG
jgi:hypothetical protein